MFPEEFDLEIYCRKKKDLAHLSNQDIIEHYKIHGKKEGRVCSRVENKFFIHDYIPSFSNVLEIGPFDNPLLVGNNVEYFDVLSSEGLFNRANNIGRTHNLHKIPFIHHVSPNGDLSIIPKKYDLVSSCHSIEHQIDFIQHILDVENILVDGGYYLIIIPDKRYCFDHNIRETTIADVLHYHVHKTENHTLKSVIEHRALTCHNDSGRHWRGDHGINTIDASTVTNAIHEYENAFKEGKYVDVHALQFTPDSFRQILSLLCEMKYVRMHVDKIYPTLFDSCEFIVILQKRL